MGTAKWTSRKFILTDSHEKVSSAWGKSPDAILVQLLKLEIESEGGVSLSFIGLYKRLGQLDFCTLDEFRQKVDQLFAGHGGLCDASGGESGEEPLCLTMKGREMAQSRYPAEEGQGRL
jgi:hypothetical protein